MIALYELFEPRKRVEGVARLRYSLWELCLTGAGRDEADGEVLQSQEVSPPVLLEHTRVIWQTCLRV